MKNFETIKGILDLNAKGYSYREIQQRFGIGASTVRRILKRFDEIPIALEELIGKTPDEVVNLFYPEDDMRRKDVPLPDYEKCYQRILSGKGRITLSYLWYEYKEEHPDGYQFTQFCEYYNRYLEKEHPGRKARMAVERVPGEKIYIDWVGDTPSLLMDAETGELKKVHVLVTAVGYSSYMFAEVFENEKIGSFTAGVADAISFYGAVPKHLVPDNLKTAITAHTKDSLILNAAFKDLESFYDVVVLPPPSRKPRGKATVENAVRTSEFHLLEKLSESAPYTSIEQINASAAKITEAINSRRKKGERLSRRELYELYDKPCMRKSPEAVFTMCEYRYFQRVPDNYHLQLGDNHYSVPHTMLGKPVLLRATRSEVIITDENNRLICRHKRSYRMFPKYITDPSHMPPSHKFYSDVNAHDGSYYRRWAMNAYGKTMLAFIDGLLKSAEHEETMYRSCNAILLKCRDSAPMNVEAAAKACIEQKRYFYSNFMRTLKALEKKLDTQEGRSRLPEHGNIRGPEEYR